MVFGNTLLMLSTFVVISLNLPGYLCWSCPGHMITAHIAQKLIGSEKVQFFQPYIDAIAAKYSNVGTMTEAACWADDIKGHHIEQYSNWHYYDGCYSVDGTPCPTSAQEDGLLLEKLPQLLLNMTTASDMDTLSFSLNFILHLMGDLHQPLHVATEYSRHFEHGDQGGNRFPVHYHRESVASSQKFSHGLNLHAYCDAVGEDPKYKLDRPVTGNILTEMDEIVSELMNITISEQEVMYNDPSEFQVWTNSTFGVAVNYIYLKGELQPGADLDEEYVNSSREVLRKQLALGGRRLASVLNWIYSNMHHQSEQSAHLA